MLPKVNRLKKKKDFDRVFKEGKRFKEDCLIFAVAKNNFKNSRFGFVVGKAVSKKTALRNKIKRRLRELAKIKLKKIKNGRDGVLIAYPGLETQDFWEIEKTMDQIFKRAKILK